MSVAGLSAIAVRPNAALGLVTTGMLLIYVECNRPGRVVPGATGLLMVLLGAHWLAAMPWHGDALWMIGSAAMLLAVLLLKQLSPWNGRVLSLVATGLLIAGLLRLPAQAGRLSPSLSVGCGLLLGLITAWLARVAARARRTKRTRMPISDQARTKGATTGAQERWE